MIEDLLARLCVHCSDPLEEPDPGSGQRDLVVKSRLYNGRAHGSCEWEARLDLASAA